MRVKKFLALIIVVFFAVSTVYALSGSVIAGAATKVDSAYAPKAASSAPSAVGTFIGQMSNENVDVSVTFGMRNSVQLDSFVANSQKQVKGQESHLSEQQFETEYSPTQGDYDAAIAFLSVHGLSVTETFSNRLLLIAQGPVDSVQEVFGVNIGLYSYMEGTFYSEVGGVSVPAVLGADGVAGISVSNFSLTSSLSRVSGLAPNGVDPNGLSSNNSPATFRDAYGTSQAIAGGWNGAGETIGIVDAYGDPTISKDVSLFDALFGLPSLSLVVNGTGGSNTGWATETALDVEWAHAMAPGASILLQLSADNSNTNLFGALNSLVEMQNPPNVISLSWGGPEYGDSYSSIFAAAAAKGIKVYVSTGDGGAFDGQSNLTVQYPASDPNVIAVGGSTLYCNNVQGTNEYYEYGWNGSGGGYSSYFSEPTYQVNAGIPDPKNMRAIPDVSLDADPYSGVVICVGGVEEGLWGGTSLSAPMMAGISAVAINGGWNLNNDVLYSLYSSSSQYDVAFHDIYLSGNNGNYSVEPGWDAVTGLGSIDFQNFANIFYQTGGVALSAQSLSPTKIGPGQSFSLSYNVSNPDPSYPLSQIGLGATIRLDGAVNGLTDSLDDVYVSLPANVSTQSRQFVTSSLLAPGDYDVLWTVWMGPPGLGNCLATSGWQLNQLQVISQCQVTFDYQVSGGGSPSPPLVSYVSLGSQYSITAGPSATVWADYGSTYTYSPNPLVGSSGSERWQAASGTSGTVTSSTTISPVYYHQYLVTANYSTGDGSVPSSAPLLVGTQFGSSYQVPISEIDQMVWLDGNTQWYVTNTTAFLSHSSSPVPNPTPTLPDSPPSLSIFSPANSSYTLGSSIPLSLVYNSSLVDGTYGFPVFWNVMNDSTGSWVYSVGGMGIGMADEPYNVTGYPSSFNIDLSTYNNQNLPVGEYTVYAYAGNQYGLTGPVCVTFSVVPPDEQWACYTGNSGSVTQALTISPTFSHQYYLTVDSPYGSTSGSGWYDAGAIADFGVTSSVSVGAGERYAFVSWTGSGLGSYSGNAIGGSCEMNSPVTETASWNVQYYLAVTSSYGSPVGQGWYDSGSSVTFGVTTPFSGGIGVRYLLNSWSGVGAGSYSGLAASDSLTMDNAITEVASWTTQYYLTVDSNGVGTTAGSGWYNSGSLVQASVLSNIVSGGVGTQYVFSGWTGGASGSGSTSNGIIMNSPQTATASWITQYEVTFVVTPVGSASVTPAGGSVWVDSGSLSIGASPVLGYTFSQWTSDVGSITFENYNAASTVATVNGPGTITATLALTQTAAPTTPAVPEFSSLMILSILMVLSLVAAIVFSANRRAK